MHYGLSSCHSESLTKANNPHLSPLRLDRVATQHHGKYVNHISSSFLAQVASLGLSSMIKPELIDLSVRVV